MATGLGELPTHHELGLHGGFPRPPAQEPVRAGWRGLWGSQQCKTGPAAQFKQRGRFVGRGDTLGSTGVEKRTTTSSIWHLLSTPPYDSLHHGTYSCPKRLPASRSCPCIPWVSEEPFITSHTKHTY